MRIAVIDCGTNTFNVLVVERKNGSVTRIYNTRRAVKLGENAINEGYIADLPFERGLAAMREFGKIISGHNVNATLAFATSAIRDANNGIDFVNKVREETGININVINGDREAQLIYRGCCEAAKLGKTYSLIMDIGGGSTEFIIANEEGISWKKSYNLGAARLLERFRPEDPIRPEQLESIHNYLRTETAELKRALLQFPVAELLGSSGAFDSVVEMIAGELGGEPLSVSKMCYQVDLSAYDRISKMVKDTDLEERKRIKGLVPMRFDMIVISCILIDFALQISGAPDMRVSTYSLKEGALAEFLSTNI